MPKSTIVSMQLKHVPLEMTSKASTVEPSSMNWRLNIQLSLSACRFQTAVNWLQMRKSRNGQPSISMEAISKVQELAMSCKITPQTNTSTWKQVKPSFLNKWQKSQQLVSVGWEIRSNTSQRVATLLRIPSFKSVPTSGITLIRTVTWSQVNRSLMARNISS